MYNSNRILYLTFKWRQSKTFSFWAVNICYINQWHVLYHSPPCPGPQDVNLMRCSFLAVSTEPTHNTFWWLSLSPSLSPRRFPLPLFWKDVHFPIFLLYNTVYARRFRTENLRSESFVLLYKLITVRYRSIRCLPYCRCN